VYFTFIGVLKMNTFSIFLMSLIFASQVFAADFITLIYGPIKRSFPIAELHHLEKTGQAIGSSAELFRLAKVKPEQVRDALKMSFELDVVDASNFLNSTLANGILTKIGRAIHPPYSSKYSVQAFRSAFIASAADSQVKIMEVFDQYPTKQIWVDLEVLPKVLEELGGLISGNK
jgi:hypothetical protein